MPRQVDSRKTNKRTGYQSAGATKSTSVVATPVPASVSSDQNQFGQLLSALQGVSPRINSILQQENAKANYDEFQRGVLHREGTPMSEIEAEQARIKEQNINFQQGYMFQHGKVSAVKAGEELRRKYEDGTFNRETDDIDKFTREFIQNDTKGILDDNYLDGYLPIMERETNLLRDAHFKLKQGEVAEKVKTNAFEWALAVARDKDDSGAHLSGAEIAGMYKENKDLFQMSNPEQDEILYSVGVQFAQEGKLRALNMFDEPKPGGVPAMSKNPKWADKIMNLKAEATRVLKQKQAEADDVLKLRAKQKLYALADNAQLTQDVLEKAVKDNHLSAGEGFSIDQHNIKRKNEIARDQQIIEAIGHDDMSTLSLHEQKYVKANFDKWGGKILEEGKDDQAFAIGRILDKGSKLGVKYGPWDYTLANANPSNPASWDQGYELYTHMKGTNAPYLETYLDDKQSLMFTIYDNAIQAGIEKDEAKAQVLLYATPEYRAQAQALLKGSKGYEISATIANELDDGENKTYVEARIKNLMMVNMISGNSSPDEAYKWAKKRFEANHKEVNGRYLYTGGLPLPDKFEKAGTWALEKYQEKLKSDKKLYSEEGYYLIHTPRTRNNPDFYAIAEKDTNILVGEISVKSMMKAYHHRGAEEEKQRVIDLQKRLNQDTPVNDDDFMN